MSITYERVEQSNQIIPSDTSTYSSDHNSPHYLRTTGYTARSVLQQKRRRPQETGADQQHQINSFFFFEDEQKGGIFGNYRHKYSSRTGLEIIQLDDPVHQHLYPPFYLTTPKEWIKIHNTRQQNDNYKKFPKKKRSMREEREGIQKKYQGRGHGDEEMTHSALSSPAPPGDYRRT